MAGDPNGLARSSWKNSKGRRKWNRWGLATWEYYKNVGRAYRDVGRCRVEQSSLFSVVSSNRIRGHGHKLEHGKFQ